MARKIAKEYPVYYCNIDGLKKCEYTLTYRESIEYADRVWYLGYNIEYINGVFILWRRKENGKTE